MENVSGLQAQNGARQVGSQEHLGVPCVSMVQSVAALYHEATGQTLVPLCASDTRARSQAIRLNKMVRR